MSMKISVIGLGAMGGAIAANLVVKGYEVTGFDPSPAATASADAAGVRTVADIQVCLAGAEVVITSLPNSAIVADVWQQPGGVLESAPHGAVLVEMSSIDPQTMRDLAAEADARGLLVLDCPVSGGPGEAINGTLTLLVGGEAPTVERVRPVLDAMGVQVSFTGPVGTGKTVKIVNNLMAMGNVLVAAEAFAVGVAAGVDPQRLLDVLSVSGGRSHHLLKRFPKAITGNFDPGFKLALGEKDLGLGMELGRSVSVPTPVAGLVRELFRMGMADGLTDEDVVSVLKLYLSWSGADPSQPLVSEPVPGPA